MSVDKVARPLKENRAVQVALAGEEVKIKQEAGIKMDRHQSSHKRFLPVMLLIQLLVR